MKRIVSIITMTILLAAASINGLSASGQQAAGQDPFAGPRARQKEFTDKLPAVVERAKSPEARAAWEKLPPELREVVKTEVHKILDQETGKFLQQRREQKAQRKAERKTLKDAVKGKEGGGIDTSLGFSDENGNRQFLKAKEREFDMLYVSQDEAQPAQSRLNGKNDQLARSSARKPYGQWGNSLKFASGSSPTIKRVSFVNASAPAMAQGGADADVDGLPEDFENSLADAFTPVYHISASEVNNFATFHNSVPQEPLQLFGPNPVSHFRVQPLGFAYTASNQLVSVIRIDYLTLWDHDNGLVTGGGCSLFPGLNLLEGMKPHRIDNERSAVLVAAPVWGYSFNLDPWAYSAYDYYTAAHENEPNSKSSYHTPYTPVPAGWHLRLASSLSKHATYTFNPDYLSLLPDYVIFGVLASADLACYFAAFDSWLDWRNYVCLAAIYYAYGLIYECAVERFIDQGGRFADIRINVGEPNSPINNSAFIQDNTHKLYDKLVTPLWLLN